MYPSYELSYFMTIMNILTTMRIVFTDLATNATPNLSKAVISQQ